MAATGKDVEEQKEWGLGPIYNKLYNQIGYNKAAAYYGKKHFLEDINAALLSSVDIKSMFKEIKESEIESTLKTILNDKEAKLRKSLEFLKKQEKNKKTSQDEFEKSKTFELSSSLTFSPPDEEKLLQFVDQKQLEMEIKGLKELIAIMENKPDPLSPPEDYKNEFVQWDKSFREWLEKYKDSLSLFKEKDNDLLLPFKIMIGNYYKNQLVGLQVTLEDLERKKWEEVTQTKFIQEIQNMVTTSLNHLTPFVEKINDELKISVSFRHGSRS